jgi:hypothetical protein
MRPVSELLLDLLTGADLTQTDRRALPLYFVTLARRVRELQTAKRCDGIENLAPSLPLRYPDTPKTTYGTLSVVP